MRALMFASVASMVWLFNRENIEMLEDLGYEVTVAANFTEGSVFSKKQAREFMAELKISGHDVIDVPIPRSLKDVKGFIKSYLMLRRDMKKKHYDIIYTQSPIGGVIARLAAAPFRKEGAKVIYYAHGFHFFKGADLINWFMYYPAELIFARFTDYVITLNKEDYNRAKRHFKTKVIYFPGVGIDFDDVATRQFDDPDSVKEELGITKDKKIVLTVSELSVRKNCEVALKAFARADRDDAVLLLCGIGEQMDMLKDMASNLGVGDKVFFAGFRNDNIEIMKMSDVFIFTSKQEGLPAALMEAMACGLPALCSRIRGNRELIRDKKNGFMYSYDDVAGFEDGLNKLLDNEALRKKMGERSKAVIRKYDRNNTNRLMNDLFIKITDEIKSSK